MTQLNKFQSMGTGSFLKNAFNKDGSAVYSGTGFRHLTFETSFPEYDQSQISNAVQLCIFDKEQNIYRLWNIQSVGNVTSPIDTAWQEYCSADLVTWVHNRDYNVNFSQNITAITSTFKDGNNIYGFGPYNRVIQITGQDGKTYNFYTPKLGLCPVTDGAVHSPINFYNESNKTYFSVSPAPDGNGVNVTTYTNSETPTTVEVTPGNANLLYNVGGTAEYIIDGNGNGQYYIACMFSYSRGRNVSLGYCPIFNNDGTVNSNPQLTISGGSFGTAVLETVNENVFITSSLPITGSVVNGTLIPSFPASVLNSFSYSQGITALSSPTLTTDAYSQTNTYALNLPQTTQEANDGYVRQIGDTSIYGYSFALSLNTSGNGANGYQLYLPNSKSAADSIALNGGLITVIVDGPFVDYIVGDMVYTHQSNITLNGSNIKIAISNSAPINGSPAAPTITLNSATIYYD